MNDEQLNQLFQAARRSRPDTSRAEYGFETRLLAAIRESRKQPIPLATLAWRLMPAFAAVVVVAGVWSYNVQSQMNVEASLGEEMPVPSLLGGE